MYVCQRQKQGSFENESRAHLSAYQMQIVTVEFEVDLVSGFALGRTVCPLLMTSTDKNNLSCSAVVFSACKLKKLFPVIYCVVRAVHEFDFRFVTNET